MAKNKKSTKGSSSSSSRVLTVEDDQLNPLSKKRAKKIESKLSDFKVDSKKIQQMINAGESDDAIITFQKSMLRSVIGMIPVAEAKYRGNPTMSMAYALGSLVNQARELIADISAAEDRVGLAASLCESQIRPAWLDLANNTLNSTSILLEQLSAEFNDKQMKLIRKMINTGLKEQIRYMQDRHDRLVEQVKQLLCN